MVLMIPVNAGAACMVVCKLGGGRKNISKGTSESQEVQGTFHVVL